MVQAIRFVAEVLTVILVTLKLHQQLENEE